MSERIPERKMGQPRKALLFFNPKSGRVRAEHHRDLIRNHFDAHKIDLEIIVFPKEFETLGTIVDTAISQGVDLFIAAGGDGTVSLLSTHLVGKEKSLGILPLGTGNLLAKALGIPQNIKEALDLVTSANPNKVNIDTFKMNERYFVMNISVGLSPKLMESVDSEQKQHLGFFAYLINFIKQILGLQLYRVHIEHDHKKTTVMASEILITNISTAGVDPLIWSEDISLTDGILDLLIFRAANIWDVLGVVKSIIIKKDETNSVVKFMKVKEYCRIETRSPLHTQADGDVIGETPFEIAVFPNSLSIIAGKNLTLIHKE